MGKKEEQNKYKRITGANDEDKIFIVGPGRAGTTFLVKLLTRLGFSTGLYPYEEDKGDYGDTRAGCEVEIELPSDLEEAKEKIRQAPFILKGPAFSTELKNITDCGLANIVHAFIPVRDLFKTAQSRIDVGLDWIAEEIQPLDRPRIIKQYYSNAIALGCAIEGCMMREIPFSLMRFPDFVEDMEYCYEVISRIFPHIKKEDFEEAFKSIVKSDKIKFK